MVDYMSLEFTVKKFETKRGKTGYFLTAWYSGIPTSGGRHKNMASVRRKKAELKKQFMR